MGDSELNVDVDLEQMYSETIPCEITQDGHNEMGLGECSEVATARLKMECVPGWAHICIGAVRVIEDMKASHARCMGLPGMEPHDAHECWTVQNLASRVV